MECKYTKEELDFVEKFIDSCDGTGDVRRKIQYHRDQILEEELKEKYLGKFVRVEDKTNTSNIFIGHVFGISVRHPYISISSKYYIEERRGPCGECVFRNKKSAESRSFNPLTTTIDEITQEEFEEYLINNMIGLENKKEEGT